MNPILLISTIAALLCGLGFAIGRRKPKNWTLQFKKDCNKLGKEILSYPVTMIMKDRAMFLIRISAMEDQFKDKVKDKGILKTGIDELHKILNSRVVKKEAHQVRVFHTV